MITLLFVLKLYPVHAQANVSSNGADAVLSKPLPTPPPNRLKVGSKGKFARPGVSYLQ